MPVVGSFQDLQNVFDIFSGFYEDAVSSEGHDKFSGGFLKIYNI